MTNTGETVKRTRKQTRVAQVVSTGGDKTIRVTINSLAKHGKYNKYVRRRTKLAVHDPANAARIGDTVEISPCRRLSKNKSWRLVRVVRSSAAAEGSAE